MTKFVVVADVHLGNHRRHGGPAESSLNRRCREGLGVLRAAVEEADASGCAAGFVLGDLLDYQRPEAQLLAEVQALFRSARARWSVLLGNHEQTSTAPGDHALGPLSGAVRVVDRPEVVRLGDAAEVGLLPFRPGAPASAWLEEAVRGLFPRPPAAPRVLGVHLGVSDDATAPWLRGAQDSVPVDLLAGAARAVGARWVFAGNWHDRRSWCVGGVYVLQLGALVPTGWDNPGLDGYGTLAVWDDGEVSFTEVPGPRFLKLRGLGGVQAAVAAATSAGHQPYVELTADPEHLPEAAAVLEACGVPGEALAEGATAAAEARSAAVAARTAGTLEEALHAFVREAPLPPGVPAEEGEAFRAEVLRAARGYLADPEGE